MAVSLRIEPSNFVVPTGPAVIFVKVDRESLRHLDVSMDLLPDADSTSKVLRKRRGAIEYARRQLSDILFGDDVAPADITTVLPHPDFAATLDSEPLLLAKYICCYWKRYTPAGGDLSSALVELTSESVSVNNCLGFHAVEVVHEKDKAIALDEIFSAESRSAAMRAEHAQAQAQARAQARTALQE